MQFTCFYKIIKLHIIIISFKFGYICAWNTTWIDILMNNIVHNEKYHQITIVKNCELLSSEETYLLKKLFFNIPVIIIDVKKGLLRNDKQSLTLPIF